MSDIANFYVDEFQQLSGFSSTGTALFDTSAFAGASDLVLTGISLDGVNFTPVAAGSSPSTGGGTTLTGTYLSFDVTADGSISLVPQPDAQGVVDDINANADAGNSAPLSDVLYYQVYDPSTGTTVVNQVEFDLNDIGFTGLPGSLLVAPDATVAVPGISITQSTSSNGSGDNPFIAVTLQVVEGTIAIGGDAAGTSSIDNETNYVVVQGSQADVNADLANLTYTADDNGGNGTGLFMTVSDGPAQSADYYLGNFVSPVSNVYDSEISPNSGGTGGSLDGTEANGVSGVKVIAISADGVNFTAVPDDGSSVTVDGTYETFSADQAGDGGNSIPDAQADINAINANNIDPTATGPLTDTFYYEVEDAAGNTAIDQYTFTYGDVAGDLPPGLGYGNTIDVTPGNTVSLSGIMVEKAPSTDGNTVADDPMVAITVGLSNYSGQGVGGTLSAQDSSGATITYGTNSVTITGLQSQVNTDLQSLTYTAGATGSDYLTITTTDDSYVSGYSYQSATYVDALFQVTCFAPGTAIATPDGEMPIERLGQGDLVLTASGEAKPVLWAGHFRVLCNAASMHRCAPVRISAGALGENLPHRDLVVSPDHAMFLHGALVPAQLLVNGTNITQPARHGWVEYFHLEIEPHDIIIAEGALTESYLDFGQKAQFPRREDAFLNKEPKTWEDACAPLLLAGPALEGIRAEINGRIEVPAILERAA